MQVALYFEAFYALCLWREKQYYKKQGGQDLRHKAHFAAKKYVQVQTPW
jgi:hypothetical protein